MIKPNFKLNLVSSENNSAVIHMEPLEKGFGHTLGNALRRVLLTSLPGSAATEASIEGVNHQFTTLDGLQENIVDFLINLKGVRFNLQVDGPVTVKIDQKGKKELTAKDLECPGGVEVLNPDHHLGTLTTDKSKLKATIQVDKGVGYVTSDEHGTPEVGVVPLDSAFTPVIKANYSVEATRVGRRTDLDRLVLSVETDGSMTPQEAVKEAALLLSNFFTHVYQPTFEAAIEEPALINPLMDQTVEELGLPTRITNSLKKGGFKKLSDFNKATHADLLKIKNMGAKSVEDVLAALAAKKIELK